MAEKDAELVCIVCRDGGWTEANKIVLCEKCEISVHQHCYGIAEVPGTDIPWYCDLCLFNGQSKDPRNPTCVLCHETSGAFKKVDDEIWVHCGCILATPETSFKDIIRLERPNGFDSFSVSRRKNHLCIYCDKMKGVTIKCSIKSCASRFHISCGHNNQAIFQLRATSGEKKAFCRKHRNHFFRSFGPNQVSDVEYRNEIENATSIAVTSPTQKSQISPKVLWKETEAFDKPFDEESLGKLLSETERVNGDELSELGQGMLTVVNTNKIDFQEIKPDFRFDFLVNHKEFNQNYVKSTERSILKVDETFNELFSISNGSFEPQSRTPKNLKGTEKYDKLLKLNQLAVTANQSSETDFTLYKELVTLHQTNRLNIKNKNKLKLILYQKDKDLFKKLKLSLPPRLLPSLDTSVSKKTTGSTPMKKRKLITLVSTLDKKRMNTSSFQYFRNTDVQVMGPKRFSERLQRFVKTEEKIVKSLSLSHLTPQIFEDDYIFLRMGFSNTQKMLKSFASKRKLNAKLSLLNSTKKQKKNKPKLLIHISCVGPNQYTCSRQQPVK